VQILLEHRLKRLKKGERGQNGRDRKREEGAEILTDIDPS